MPPEKEVLWIHSFGYEWNSFILPFLDTLGGYTLLKRYGVIFFVFWPFRGTVGEGHDSYNDFEFPALLSAATSEFFWHGGQTHNSGIIAMHCSHFC